MTDIIIPSPRRVLVNRRTPHATVLEGIGHKVYASPATLMALPDGKGDEVELVFFLGPNVPRGWGERYYDCVMLEYKKNSLKPDPRAQAVANTLMRGMLDENQEHLPQNQCLFLHDYTYHLVTFGRRDAFPSVEATPVFSQVLPMGPVCDLYAGVRI